MTFDLHYNVPNVPGCPNDLWLLSNYNKYLTHTNRTQIEHTVDWSEKSTNLSFFS